MFELLESMPAWELTFWQAYERVEGPIGDKRLDYAVGFLGCLAVGLSKDFKPEHGYAFWREFLQQETGDPGEVFTPEELNATPEDRRDELANKIFNIFGLPPDDILKNLQKGKPK